MRKLLTAALLLICFLFSGCGSSETIPDSNVNSPDTSSGGSSSSDPDLYTEVFAYSSRLFISDPGGELAKTRFETPADGKPLKFRILDSSDSGEPSIVRKIVPSDLSDIFFDMEVELDPNSKIETISVIWNMYPEYIPKKGYGAFSGCLVHSMQNEDQSYNFTVSDNDSGYFNITSEKTALDIGGGSLESSETILENHFYDDITLTPQNKELFIKFNSGQGIDNIYYLILFRDGKLLDAFDGEYSRMVDCRSGERAFQFKIPEDYIPNKGLHTFQAVAVPVYAYDKNNTEQQIGAVRTTKTRVQIK